MKKNINNKIYDTETSSELQKRTINPASRDCTITETLYKAQDGDFFLTHDITGGGTCSFESEWCLKHDVCPLTIEQAKEWVIQYANDLYYGLFSDKYSLENSEVYTRKYDDVNNGNVIVETLYESGKAETPERFSLARITIGNDDCFFDAGMVHRAQIIPISVKEAINWLKMYAE